jgi:hypothetical protein
LSFTSRGDARCSWKHHGVLAMIFEHLRLEYLGNVQKVYVIGNVQKVYVFEVFKPR